MRRAPLFLALAIAAPVLWLLISVAAPQEDCGPDMESTQIDGFALCTHGDDDPPPGVDTNRLPSTDALWQGRFGIPAETAHPETAAVAFVAGPDGSTACGDASGPRVQLVYARAADVPDRYGPVTPLIQQYAADADSIVHASAGRVGDGRRIRYVTGDDCRPALLDVTLTTSGDDSFGNTVRDLRAQGLTDPDQVPGLRRCRSGHLRTGSGLSRRPGGPGERE